MQTTTVKVCGGEEPVSWFFFLCRACPRCCVSKKQKNPIRKKQAKKFNDETTAVEQS
jgi:hypothetical protein